MGRIAAVTLDYEIVDAIAAKGVKVGTPHRSCRAQVIVLEPTIEDRNEIVCDGIRREVIVEAGLAVMRDIGQEDIKTPERHTCAVWRNPLHLRPQAGGASWMNMVDRFFCDLTSQGLRP